MYIYKRIMFTLDIILIRSHFNFYMKRMFFFKTNESCRHQWYSDIVWSYYLDHMVIQSCLLYSIFLCIFIRSSVLRLNTKWIEANECSTINHRKLPQPYWYVVVGIKMHHSITHAMWFVNFEHLIINYCASEIILLLISNHSYLN